MFWELYQQSRIEGARADASSARSAAENAKLSLQQLEDKIDGLSLVCQAMFEVLADKLDFPQTEIEAKMEEIDLRDGRLDGKISSKPLNCAKCQRRVNSRRKKCLYCGEPVPGDLFGRV